MEKTLRIISIMKNAIFTTPCGTKAKISFFQFISISPFYLCIKEWKKHSGQFLSLKMQFSLHPTPHPPNCLPCGKVWSQNLFRVGILICLLHRATCTLLEPLFLSCLSKNLINCLLQDLTQLN